MSHQADEDVMLRTLAREGGRLKASHLTYDGILAASQLARAGRVWDLVLIQQEPRS